VTACHKRTDRSSAAASPSRAANMLSSSSSSRLTTSSGSSSADVGPLPHDTDAAVRPYIGGAMVGQWSAKRFMVLLMNRGEIRGKGHFAFAKWPTARKTTPAQGGSRELLDQPAKRL